MKLRLKRIACKPSYTIGRLYVDGEYFCDTIEDRDRGLDNSMTEQEIKSNKVYAETAIPTGTYSVTMNVQSPKYKTRPAYAFCKGFLPRLVGVKGFDGVLIHIGNTQKDSAGCILVGQNKEVGKVINSTETFKRLYAVLQAANNRGEKISITIEK